jgi:Transposase and inactivated derivatives
VDDGEDSQSGQAIGRSAGGLSSKIHAACDSHGNPIRFCLSEGQASDYTKAIDLLDGFVADAVLADKGYDADYVVEQAAKMGAVAVIPPKKNRLNPREYDKVLYKERNQVERLFNRLKHWRRIATRYDKTACSFMGFVLIAAITIWLR